MKVSIDAECIAYPISRYISKVVLAKKARTRKFTLMNCKIRIGDRNTKKMSYSLHTVEKDESVS